MHACAGTDGVCRYAAAVKLQRHMEGLEETESDETCGLPGFDRPQTFPCMAAQGPLPTSPHGSIRTPLLKTQVLAQHTCLCEIVVHTRTQWSPSVCEFYSVCSQKRRCTQKPSQKYTPIQRVQARKAMMLAGDRVRGVISCALLCADLRRRCAQRGTLENRPTKQYSGASTSSKSSLTNADICCCAK